MKESHKHALAINYLNYQPHRQQHWPPYPQYPLRSHQHTPVQNMRDLEQLQQFIPRPVDLDHHY